MKLGIVGLNNFDNGHPFSFSAIVNGYNKKYFKKSKFKNILKYLQLKSKKNFGIANVKITHAWTQDPKITKSLCKSCYIKNCLKNYKDMVGEIDALIIARDDLHYTISKYFLKRKIPVFVDKPLTTKKKEFNFFKKYIKSGMLMSTSGLRFSKEVNILKNKIKSVGKIKIINACVVNDFEKYGIHMLDILDELKVLKVKKIVKSKKTEIVSYYCNNGLLINIFCLGKVSKIFNLHIVGSKKSLNIDINDNFIAFKNTLTAFVKMVKTKKPIINQASTINVINLLISTMDKKNVKI